MSPSEDGSVDERERERERESEKEKAREREKKEREEERGERAAPREARGPIFFSSSLLLLSLELSDTHSI